MVGRKEVVFRTYLACSAVFTYGSYRPCIPIVLFRGIRYASHVG